MELIAQQTLTSNTTTVTFSSIPQTFRDISLVATVNVSTTSTVRFQVNGDTAANYGIVYMSGNGSSTSSYAAHGIGFITTSSYDQNASNPAILRIESLDYALNTHKTFLIRNASNNLYVDHRVARWVSTSPITSISFYNSAGSFTTGSIFTLYGIPG